MAKVANTKVKAWRRGAMKGKGKETAIIAPMFGTIREKSSRYLMANALRRRPPNHQSGSLTGYPRNLHPPRDLYAWSASPLHAVYHQSPIRRARFAPMYGSCKLGLDETMELLSRVLGAGEEDCDLSAL